eukprot:11205203-Lingulodinium_polyedra.AAC.1
MLLVSCSRGWDLLRVLLGCCATAVGAACADSALPCSENAVNAPDATANCLDRAPGAAWVPLACCLSG